MLSPFLFSNAPKEDNKIFPSNRGISSRLPKPCRQWWKLKTQTNQPHCAHLAFLDFPRSFHPNASELAAPLPEQVFLTSSQTHHVGPGLTPRLLHISITLHPNPPHLRWHMFAFVYFLPLDCNLHQQGLSLHRSLLCPCTQNNVWRTARTQ